MVQILWGITKNTSPAQQELLPTYGKMSQPFCRWKALNLDRMQSWEPSDLRGFFLFGPTPVMSSSLPGLLFLSAVALCSPCESRCQKRLMGHSIASLVFFFLPSQWLPPFLFSPCLSWPVWGSLRLTITTTMHKAFSHQLEDSPWFLHLTCSQEWSRPWTDECFLLSPMSFTL